jgi:hypothetical protein
MYIVGIDSVFLFEENNLNYRAALPVLSIYYLHVSYITFAKYITNTTIVG